MQREYLVLKVCLMFSYFHFCYHLQSIRLQTLRCLAFLNYHSSTKFLSLMYFLGKAHTFANAMELLYTYLKASACMETEIA